MGILRPAATATATAPPTVTAAIATRAGEGLQNRRGRELLQNCCDTAAAAVLLAPPKEKGGTAQAGLSGRPPPTTLHPRQRRWLGEGIKSVMCNLTEEKLRKEIRGMLPAARACL